MVLPLSLGHVAHLLSSKMEPVSLVTDSFACAFMYGLELPFRKIKCTEMRVFLTEDISYHSQVICNGGISFTSHFSVLFPIGCRMTGLVT